MIYTLYLLYFILPLTMSRNNNNNSKTLLLNTINFDEAQKEWRKNKRSIGNGAFKYTCGCLTKKGNPCNNAPSYNGKCFIHRNQ